MKQGDPLSSLLFNSVSEDVFRPLQERWQKRKHGLHLTPLDDTTLTNLRFADDVLFFARSLPQLKSMLADVCAGAENVGLQLHPDKTKILHNIQRRRPTTQPEHVQVCELNIEVLPFSASQKYLGRKLTFHQPTDTEVESRIAIAWKKFYMLKQELTTKSYSLKGRLRLFHGTITPTVLYGSASWTLTTELSNRLRRTQRQMLRMIVSTPRRRTTTSTPPTATTTTATATFTTLGPTPPTTLQKPLPQPPHEAPPLPLIPTLAPPQQQTIVLLSYPTDLLKTAHTTTPSVVHNLSPSKTSDPGSDAHDVDSNPPDDPQPTTDAYDEENANDDESWVEWIRRCTHTAEALLKSLGVDDWVSEQRRKKWRFAAKVVTDSVSKWNIKALMWEPEHDARYNAKRRQGRPVMRWTDDLAQHVNETHTPQHNHVDNKDDDNNDDNTDADTHSNDEATETSSAAQLQLVDWMATAADRHLWRQLEDKYVKGMVELRTSR